MSVDDITVCDIVRQRNSKKAVPLKDAVTKKHAPSTYTVSTCHKRGRNRERNGF